MFCINGRFAKLHITGIERYAREIVRQLPCDSYRLIEPRRALYGAQGMLWEQTVLAAKVSSSLLWSPANLGPIVTPNHVVTVHDLSVCTHPEWFARQITWAYRAIVPVLTQRALHILTDSSAMKADIVQMLGVDPMKISVVYPGVDLAALRCLAASVAPDVHSPFVLAYAGSDPRKNVARSVAAWRILRRTHPGLELHMFGAPSSVFNCAGQVSETDGIRVLGYLSEQVLAAKYRDAALLLYPSLYEGFGLPPLEALAFGTPSVVSDIPIFHEILGPGAFFADPMSADAIAAAAEMALTDSGAREKVRSAGSEIVGRYTWQTAAASLRAIMEAMPTTWK